LPNVYPCAQEDHPAANIPAASEGAAERSPACNAPFSGSETFKGPKPGHVQVQEPGREADTTEVQTAKQYGQNNVTGRCSTGNLKVALGYGVNSGQVTYLSQLPLSADRSGCFTLCLLAAILPHGPLASFSCATTQCFTVKAQAHFSHKYAVM
jgi:hypothetical protein